EFAAQGFIGVGYELMENLDITFGGRILGTTKYTFTGTNTLPAGQTLPAGVTSPSVSTDTIHWMVEAGVSWAF
ncbi:MAG TPA: hypothetical protein PLV25_05520, partial [Opitutales bacterium]|nr:hypothetical protein [Opitutales bacterium]